MNLTSIKKTLAKYWKQAVKWWGGLGESNKLLLALLTGAVLTFGVLSLRPNDDGGFRPLPPRPGPDDPEPWPAPRPADRCDNPNCTCAVCRCNTTRGGMSPGCEDHEHAHAHKSHQEIAK